MSNVRALNTTLHGSHISLKQPKAMQFPVRVPAHAKNNGPVSANTAGHDKNSCPPSAGNRSPAVGATQLGGARAARSWVTGWAHADFGNASRQGVEGQFHKGASRRRAQRRAVSQWRSPPGRRHMELRGHARNNAKQRMSSFEAVLALRQCQEGGKMAHPRGFGKRSPCQSASPAERSPAYACARRNYQKWHVYAPRRTAP